MAAFVASFGRGPIRRAIDYEESLGGHHDNGAAAHEDLFSRGVQEIGGALGLVIFGVALGVVFAVVFARLGSRMGAASVVGATSRLALAGFVTLVLVPFLAYPANPPAVGDPDTVTRRTVLYFASVALSLALTLVVRQLWHRAAGWPPGRRAWAVACAYAAGLAVVLLALPGADIEIEAPADLVWSFRLVSLGAQAVAWTVLALTSATLLTRAQRTHGPD